ncbi:hypothetical protein QEZ54_08745 [Catellatospora sp. KI3]|uniref:hypothetical protein n=1 Tax=Catellatospora sp. KI3 TaxID=3041620 RepID=UPI0024829EF2|nr:hypothetical protein [Catellatospora sp. KI3]MDI1461050.1 hypothetical protein [Catellatospora sp. KI3]
MALADLFTIGLGSAAQAVASLFNTQQQIKASRIARAEQRTFETAQADRRFQRELVVEAMRTLRQEELAELEARLRREGALAALRDRTTFDTYPIEEGPGHLRGSLELIAPDLSALPLLVLLPRAHGTTEPQWNGLRHAIVDALRRQLVADGLVLLYDAMRTLSWPHAGLYWNDLYGIPTLVVQTTFFQDKLDIGLGGCHLSPGAAAEPIRNVYRHRLVGPEFWTPEIVAELNAGVPASHQFVVPRSDAGRVQVNVDVAARAVSAVVTAAVDAYYLGSRGGYRARFDEAVALLGRAAPPDWPIDLGVPLAQVADPAFHLLQVASRQSRRGDPAGALATVRHALAVLAHPDYAMIGPPFPPDDQLAVALAEAGLGYREEFGVAMASIRTAGADDQASGRDLAALEAIGDA